MNKQRLFWGLLLAFSCLCLNEVQAQSLSWKMNRRGNRFFSQKRYGEAIQCYNQALIADTTDARAYFNRGDAYLAQNNVPQAMSDYQKAVQYEKDKEVKAMAFHNMGYVHQAAANAQKAGEQKQKDLQQAIDFYKEALRNNPKDNGTRYNLALCQKQLKDSQQQQSSSSSPKPQSQRQNRQQEKNTPGELQQPKEAQSEKDPQTQQLLNLSRKAEQSVRQRLNKQRARRTSKNKNW